MSYWARTVMVPLLVLAALKPRARNPRGVRIQELLRRAGHGCRPRPPSHQKRVWALFFNGAGSRAEGGRALLAEGPAPTRHRALRGASSTERLNGEDGLGAIYPAMANAVMMYDALGYPPDHPDRAIARRAVDKLLVVQRRRGLLPALRLAGLGHGARRARPDGDGRQGRGRRGRGAASTGCSRCRCSRRRATGPTAGRSVRPGGWAFQYRNAHYPDLDDTAVVVMAMDRARRDFAAGNELRRSDRPRHANGSSACKARNGGWGAFDADNIDDYLNNIPFADHGALLDPPTADVTRALRRHAGATRRTCRQCAR